MGYTKLFSEIVGSTIWDEKPHVKIVWITMLALKDDRHEVLASIPGFAHLSRVTFEECEEALQSFLAPDPHSRSQDFEGRRIEAIRGGWHILNGEYYKQKKSEEERREYMRLYMQRSRDVNNHVNKSKPSKEQLEKVNGVSQTEQNRTDYNKTIIKEDFEFWKLYPERNGLKGNKQKALEEWKKLNFEEQQKALQEITKQKQHYDHCKSKDIFISEFPDCFRWLRDKRFNDEIKTASLNAPGSTIESW